jgi:phytoene dehydrogenase-like protein
VTGADRRFDAVVVGSGLGGLMAGALCARRGLRVLVLERNKNFGGAVGTFRRGELTIEASLHELDGLDDGDAKLRAMGDAGLTESVRFVGVGDLYEVRSPRLGEPFTMPAGAEAAVEAVSARFPELRAGIGSYFDEVVGARTAIGTAMKKQDDKLWWAVRGPVLPKLFWPLLRNLRSSLGEVLSRHLGSAELAKVVLTANLPYFGGDVERLWFPFYAAAQGSYHVGGGHYAHGGSSAIVEHLLGVVREHGGAAETLRQVTRIVLEDGGVAGVEHDSVDGGDVRREEAAVVFGNAAPHALASLLPEPAREQFLAPYRDRPLSLSLWTIPLGFDRPPSELGVTSYSTWIYPEWVDSPRGLVAGARVFRDPDGPVPAFTLADYTRIDSGLGGPPYHASIGGLDCTWNWNGLDERRERDLRERWHERLVGALVREFPQLESALVHSEITTARSNERYLGTPDGAVYGFAAEAPRAHFFRPKTPVRGLWLASAWAGLGGYSGVMLGGEAAARQVLRKAPKRVG